MASARLAGMTARVDHLLDEALGLFEKAIEVLPDFEPAQANVRRALAARVGAARNP